MSLVERSARARAEEETRHSDAHDASSHRRPGDASSHREPRTYRVGVLTTEGSRAAGLWEGAVPSSAVGVDDTAPLTIEILHVSVVFSLGIRFVFLL